MLQYHPKLNCGTTKINWKCLNHPTNSGSSSKLGDNLTIILTVSVPLPYWFFSRNENCQTQSWKSNCKPLLENAPTKTFFWTWWTDSDSTSILGNDLWHCFPNNEMFSSSFFLLSETDPPLIPDLNRGLSIEQLAAYRDIHESRVIWLFQIHVRDVRATMQFPRPF